MTTLHLTLPDEMLAFVVGQAAKGVYGSTDAYLQALILDAQRREETERLEEMLLAGINSGNPIVADAAYRERFKARYAERQRESNGR